MKNIILNSLTALLIPIFSYNIACAEETPKSLVQSTLDQVVSIVEEHVGDEKQEYRRQLMRETINPHFDFEEMAKRSLGAYWKDINDSQRSEFVSIFSDMLARTYLSKIDTVERGMVTVGNEEVQGPRAFVKTIVTSKGDKFSLDYRLMNTAGKWRVYDVVIENIGVVSNYRNEFAGIIRKERFEGLIQRLREKK